MSKFRNITLYLLGLGMLLLFLPKVFANVFVLPKLLLLMGGSAVLLLIWAYEVYQQDKLRWRPTPFDLPLLAFGATYFISTLVAQQNKIASLVSPSGAGAILLLICFYFLTVQTDQQLRPANHNPTLTGLTHAALLLAVWSIFNTVLELANLHFGIQNLAFPLHLSPVGNLLSQAAFLLIILFLTAAKFIKDKADTDFLALAAPTLLFIGFLTTAYQFSRLQPLPLLPYQYGWSIAIEAFKNTPVFGVGPGNFLSAFTRFKPAVINQTAYWSSSFILSSNWYLQVLTEIGALGLAAYLLLVWQIWKNIKTEIKNFANANKTALAVILLLQLFIPFSLPLLFTQIVLLASVGTTMAKEVVSLRLVTIKEGLIEIQTGEENIVEAYGEIDIKQSS